MSENKQHENYIQETENLMGDEEIPSSKNLVYAIVLITVCGLAAIVVIQNSGNSPTLTSVRLEGENLILDKTVIDTDAKFFHYDVENVRVKFFAVEGSDGSIHVALDACDVCFAEKQGYSQQGNIMVCNNCGN